MNGLDLFSGIGGLSLALHGWVKPIAYCEIDRYAQAVLLNRMRDGRMPIAPIWDDVSTLTAREIPAPIDFIYGGFPCQDISVAGNGKGLAGERSGLFFQIIRLVKETGAPWVFLENVPAIRTRGLKEVIGAFSDLGYDCRWTSVSAAEVGAPHIRRRWFLLAHSRSERRQQESRISHGNEEKNEGRSSKENYKPECSSQKEIWSSSNSELHRVANGIPFRMDRLKGLGNAVVPAQARTAFEKLAGFNPTGANGG